MKRMIKYLSLLTALTGLLMALAVTAYADEPDPFDMSLVLSPETRLVVYADGEWSNVLSDRYGFGDTAAITAPDVSGKIFSHWEADGSVVSYSNALKLTMNAHTTLYAVYADAAPTAQPVAGFTSITRTNDGGRISFQATAYPGSGGTLDSAGIVYSSTATGDALTIGGTGVTDVTAVKLTDSTTEMPASILDDNNCWILQITPDSGDTTYHARAYVTVSGTTSYGDEKTVKLSDLESGISLIANLEGVDREEQETSLEDLLASLLGDTRTVTFSPNGGNGAVMTQVGMSGQAMTLNANTFTHTDKPFDCWNTKSDGTGTSYEDKASVTLTADLTLYAQWKEAATVSEAPAPAANTLTYNGANGGTAQALVTTGTTTEGAIQYALGNDATNAPTGEYSATIPTGTNAGTYYVWYKVVGDSHHTDSLPACVTVTINKAEIPP